MSDIDLSDPQTKAALVSVMKEISHEMHAIETARDQIKEIIVAAATTFDLEKKVLRKVAKFYHQRNIAEFENEAAEVTGLYEQITFVPPTKP